MPITVVLGALWGDEGKAKIADFLARKADVIVRFQGGCNAGHTVVANKSKYVLHIIPVGILQPHMKAIIANGVVIDPNQLLKELVELQNKGIRIENRFFISSSAHVTLPFHLYLDAYKEMVKGNNAIGTTKKGIGPTYSSKATRNGIRISDLLYPDYLSERVHFIIKQNKFKLRDWLSENDIDKLIDDLLSAGRKIKPFITDTPYLINDYIKKEKEILFEGAQGTLLDIDFGTYPYVTSSNPSIGGAITGSGVSPHHIDSIIGVFKSYITRVGKGPFPTEMNEAMAQIIRKKGNEYGATTGRPRRCGWFDIVVAKYSIMINGFKEIAITLLDVLSGTEKIKICTSYEYNNKEINYFPLDQRDFSNIKPNYITVPGWKEDITNIREYKNLPENAKNYIAKLEEILSVKIKWISVGPDRKQTIVR